jgi:disulfide bond formation protein DsbB
MSLLNTLNLFLATSGLILALITIVLFLDYFYNQSRFFNRWLSSFAWPIIMITTIGSVFITLLYSEYFGFVPCSLCWLQRIALYPQALFALMAVKTKENVFFPLYSIALSIFGFIVSVYHYIYQLQPKETLTNSLIPCLADGSTDCGTKVIEEFGFVTFPLLSAITFAFLIVMYLNMKRGK